MLSIDIRHIKQLNIGPHTYYLLHSHRNVEVVWPYANRAMFIQNYSIDNIPISIIIQITNFFS